MTWYVVRASGMVALLLLTASVVLGITLSGRARLRDWPRFALEDVHAFAGTLAGIFIALHGAALLVDHYLPFSLADLLVPGTAPYRPLATALGVVGAELLAALALTNRYRGQLPYGVWRRLHYLNFAVWPLALIHGIAAGTDSDTAWGAAVYTVCGGSVLGAVAWRTVRARVTPWAARLSLATGTVVGAELVLALTLGPLAHHG
jgi:methionine sulfoxide reductase heme-binding subunit